MRQKFSVIRDINGIPTGGLTFAEDSTCFATTLVSNVAQTLTVPDNCNMALFSFTPQGTFVSQGSDAITLPGASFANTPAELNPVCRQVIPGETLNFISFNNTYVQVRFFINNSTS